MFSLYIQLCSGQLYCTIKHWLIDWAFYERTLWDSLLSATTASLSLFPLSLSLNTIDQQWTPPSAVLALKFCDSADVYKYLLSQQLVDFQNSSTIIFSMKFATKLMPHFPPYIKCVTALLCETCTLQFNHFQLQQIVMRDSPAQKNTETRSPSNQRQMRPLLLVVTSGHVTKMAVTPFDPP